MRTRAEMKDDLTKVLQWIDRHDMDVVSTKKVKYPRIPVEGLRKHWPRNTSIMCRSRIDPRVTLRVMHVSAFDECHIIVDHMALNSFHSYVYWYSATTKILMHCGKQLGKIHTQLIENQKGTAHEPTH